MIPKTILLLGGSGQLGTALREVFADVCVIAPTHDEMQIESPLMWSRLKTFLEDGVDLVINCSAYHSLSECEMMPDRAFLINAVAVNRVANGCAQYGVPFVHVSTDYVFSGGSVHPDTWLFSSFSNTFPLNVYGVSKLAGELLALNANPKTIIIRTAGLYGPSGISGKGLHFLERNFRAAESGQVSSAVDDVFFSPSYAPYVAKAMRKIIEAQEYGIHHVAGTGCVSWYEFAAYARSISPIPIEKIGALESIRLASLNEPFKRPMRVNLVSDTPRMPPWERGVEEYIRRRFARGLDAKG